jgi:hypothetical protein
MNRQVSLYIITEVELDKIADETQLYGHVPSYRHVIERL